MSECSLCQSIFATSTVAEGSVGPLLKIAFGRTPTSGEPMAEGDGASNVKNLWKPKILNELVGLQAHQPAQC